MSVTTDFYVSMQKRERKLWIAIGALILLWLASVFLFWAFYVSLAGEKTQILAYTPTGIPKFVEYHSGGQELIEVQNFVKTSLVQTFSLKYSDFLGKAPGKAFAPVQAYFTPEYFKNFVHGMVVSQFLQRMVNLRAITVATVDDNSIEVQHTSEGYWTRATVNRIDESAKGEQPHTITYTMLLKPGPRTIANTWGLYIEKIYVVH